MSMAAVTILFAITAGVAVFAIAAVVIGREARRLDKVAPRVVYEIDAAVEFVSDRIPGASQARMTPEELRELLLAHLNWMSARNLMPTDVIDRVQDIADPVIVDETTLVAHLLGEANARGVQLLDDVDVVHVVSAHMEYMSAIGAVGPQANEV